MPDETLERLLLEVLRSRPDLIARAYGQIGGVREALPAWRLAAQWSRNFASLISRRTRKPLAAPTQELYRFHLRKLLMTYIKLDDARLMRLGHMPWNELSPRVADIYRSTRSAQGLKGNSINRELTTLMSMLTWHIDAGARLGRNPLHGTKMANERQFRRRTRLSWEQWSEFLSHGHPMLQDIGLVAYRCHGMRPAEAVLLRKTELEPEGRSIVLGDRPGCKTGRRRITCPDDAWELLTKHANISRGDYVFVDPRDPKRREPLKMTTFWWWVKQARQKSGMRGAWGERISGYSARHGGVNALLSAGTQPMHVSEEVGTSIKTLQESYLTMDDADRERIRRVSNQMRRPPHKTETTASVHRKPSNNGR